MIIGPDDQHDPESDADEETIGNLFEGWGDWGDLLYRCLGMEPG